MNISPLVLELRRRRWLGRTTLKRGELPKRPKIAFTHISWLIVLPGIVLAVLAVVAIVKVVMLLIDLAILAGFLALLRAFRNWIMPALRGEAFDDVSLAQTPQIQLFTIGALPSAMLTYVMLSHSIPMVAIAGIAGGYAFRPVARMLNGKRIPPIQNVIRPQRKTEVVELDFSTPGPFGLWIGEATGTFASLGHKAGMNAGGNITLSLADAAKNIAIFGETGTGKTTRVVTHMLVQALDSDAGALIFDIRGDFHETAQRASNLTGKTIKRIGVGQLGLNLLDGLTPNTAAGFLEAAFRLLGQGEGDSGFWVSLAVARCQSALGVLNHVAGSYALNGLYRYIFDKPFRLAAIAKAEEALLQLQLQGADGDAEAALEARRLKGALDYEATVVPGYGEREQSGLNRTIETALARFADPELEDAFCRADLSDQAHLTDLLDGAVFVAHIPRERFKAASKVVYLFIKELFFQTLNARAHMPPGPRKERPVLFLCDEYQQIASSGDANFFDTSRALGVVGIIASQSVDAYLNALGNEHAAMTLLGNFTNIIAFRSTPRTMEYLADKIGMIDIWKVSHSAGKSAESGHFGANLSEGRSTSTERQRLLDPQLFRALNSDHAVAMLAVNGSAFDDIIRVPQITSDDLR